MASSAPKSPSPSPTKDVLDTPYIPGDKIPVPEAVEGGESAWALWSEENEVHERRFADTAPASVEMMRQGEDSPGWAQTQPGSPAGLAPAPRRREEKPLFTLEAAMLVARRNNRVSPRPQRWQELHAMLPPRKTLRGVQQPPAPPTGPAWAVTPPLTKRLCFREHIEWAERQGVLESVMAFMQMMPEEDWLHMGED